MSRPNRPQHDELPAWPLGCALTLLNLLLMFSLAGAFGIVFAGGSLPGWLAVAGPALVALLVPAAELVVGVWLRRGRNPYAGQALLWGVATTLLALSLLTFVFDTINRASGAF